MSNQPARKYGDYLTGSFPMQLTLSTESSSSYHSSVVSGDLQSIASPGTAMSSSYDPSSPFPDPSYDNAFDYQLPDDSMIPPHEYIDNHLTYSNPNGILSPGSWTSQSYLYNDTFQLSVSDNETQAAFVTQQHRPTPRSLGWSMNDPLMKKYVFQVNKGKNPYFELRPEEKTTSATPLKVYLDVSSDPSKKSYECTFPEDNKRCVTREGKRITFTRPADLERHFRHIHTPKSQQETWACGYAHCTRKANNPFTRKDHYRDHLRDYHKEDIGEAKRTKGTKEDWFEHQRKWEAERIINSRNWRCAKCLHNNRVQKGWVCAQCSTVCDKERQEKRIRLAEREASAQSPIVPTCTNCRDSGLETAYGYEQPCHCQYTFDDYMGGTVYGSTGF